MNRKKQKQILKQILKQKSISVELKIQSDSQNSRAPFMARGAIPQTEFIMHSAILLRGKDG